MSAVAGRWAALGLNAVLWGALIYAAFTIAPWLMGVARSIP